MLKKKQMQAGLSQPGVDVMQPAPITQEEQSQASIQTHSTRPLMQSPPKQNLKQHETQPGPKQAPSQPKSNPPGKYCQGKSRKARRRRLRRARLANAKLLEQKVQSPVKKGSIQPIQHISQNVTQQTNTPADTKEPVSQALQDTPQFIQSLKFQKSLIGQRQTSSQPKVNLGIGLLDRCLEEREALSQPIKNTLTPTYYLQQTLPRPPLKPLSRPFSQNRTQSRIDTTLSPSNAAQAQPKSDSSQTITCLNHAPSATSSSTKSKLMPSEEHANPKETALKSYQILCTSKLMLKQVPKKHTPEKLVDDKEQPKQFDVKSFFLGPHESGLFALKCDLGVPEELLFEKRFKTICAAAQTILGPKATLDLLCATLDTYRLVYKCGEPLTDTEMSAMKRMCELLKWDIPETFVLNPINSPAVLIHWKALQGIARCLTEKQQLVFLSRLNLADTEHDQSDDVNDINNNNIPVFDSLINLSHYKDKDSRVSLRDMFSCDNMKAVVSQSNCTQVSIDFNGAVAIFEKPSSYPSMDDIQVLKSKNIYTCIGLRSKEETPTYEEIEAFKERVSFPDVAAMGPVGLDHSKTPDTWPQQEELLQRMVAVVCTQQVVHIRCKALCFDEDGSEVYMRCLSILKSLLVPTQRIQLYNVAATSQLIETWLQYFPNTYFSFSYSHVILLTDKQREALSAIDKGKILLGCSYSLMGTRAFAYSFPTQIVRVARQLNTIMNLPTNLILKLSAINAQSVYNLPTVDEGL